MADILAQVFFRPANDNVRLHPGFEHSFHRMLGGLGFKFFCSSKVWHQCKMNHHTAVTKLKTHLTNGLNIRKGLDIPYSSANLGDNKIIISGITQHLECAFDLICNMWNYLYCLAQVIAMPLLIDNGLIDASGRYVVGLGSMYIRESLVMPQIQVGFSTIFCNITFPMFIGIHCSGIYIDIRVDLLCCSREPPRL